MPRTARDRSFTLAIWRHALETLRGPPSGSAFKQLRELGERHRAGLDITAPKPASAPTARRGRPPYPWSRITQIVAEFRRSFFAQNNRAPTWKQCLAALSKVLDNVPHIETLKRKLRPR